MAAPLFRMAASAETMARADALVNKFGAAALLASLERSKAPSAPSPQTPPTPSTPKAPRGGKRLSMPLIGAVEGPFRIKEKTHVPGGKASWFTYRIVAKGCEHEVEEWQIASSPAGRWRAQRSRAGHCSRRHWTPCRAAAAAGSSRPPRSAPWWGWRSDACSWRRMSLTPPLSKSPKEWTARES